MASDGCSEVRTLKDIGNDIHEWIVSSEEWTNENLAELLGMSPSSVKRICNGTKELKASDIAILCDVMGKNASFFIPKPNYENNVLGERLFRRVKKYADKESELKQRGNAAMEKIYKEKNLFKREHHIKMLELLVETIGWEK